MLVLLSACGSAAPAPEAMASQTSTTASEPACPVPVVRLADTLGALPGNPRVTEATRRDKDSEEPEVESVISYADGELFVLVQKNCDIANIYLTAMSFDAPPGTLTRQRLAAILGATPLWRNNYAKLDAKAFVDRELASPAFREGLAKGRFSYGSDALPPTGENGGTTVSYVGDPDAAAPFRGVLTIAISAD